MKILTTGLMAFMVFLAAPEGMALDPPAAGSPPQSVAETQGAHQSYGDMVLGHAADLNLTQEQIGNIRRIHRDNQQRIGEIVRKLRQAQKLAYALFLNPASDEATIRKAAQDHTAAFEELVDTALKSRAAINALLNPEQSSRLKSFKSSP